jgi:hypothetical protein
VPGGADSSAGAYRDMDRRTIHVEGADTIGKTVSLLELMVQFFASTANQENADKIKTKTDNTGDRCKSRNLLDLGHHLGNSEEETQADPDQCDGPDDLNWIHSFLLHERARALE